MLAWAERCKLARAFLWEYSDKRLKLAQLLGHLGVVLTLKGSLSQQIATVQPSQASPGRSGGLISPLLVKVATSTCRVRPHRRFRNGGTEYMYVGEYDIKWTSGGTKCMDDATEPGATFHAATSFFNAAWTSTAEMAGPSVGPVL